MLFQNENVSKKMVGLKRTSNKRSCGSHNFCRESISPDDFVSCKLTLVDIDGNTEEAIKVVHVHDSTESCMIGFLPCNIVKSKKEKFVGQFAQIIELYEYSDNT